MCHDATLRPRCAGDGSFGPSQRPSAIKNYGKLFAGSGATEGDLVIEVRNLTKVYGKTRAVDDLTFTVRPGIITGFLGPNGAGKSTTMRVMLGLDNPTSGTATIGGRPYRNIPNPLTRVGALLDANWVHPNRSARAHLRWLSRANGLPASRVDEVLTLVGLESVARKNAGQFSLGMKQRLGIAGALLGDPEVLLFDEPVNGLDPEGILWIRTLMRNLASQGRTVLVSSHLLSEMTVTADHLVVIGRGRLIADTSTREFIDAATRSTVRVRSPRLPELRQVLLAQGMSVEDAEGALLVSGSPIEQVGDAAAAAGLALHELSAQAGSLEQAFMQLTGQAVEFPTHVVAGMTPPAAAADGQVPPAPAPESTASRHSAPEGL
jgi:ABC-2 type transport system ATP-binding protein